MEAQNRKQKEDKIKQKTNESKFTLKKQTTQKKCTENKTNKFMRTEVTRGYNIVANGWPGAYNPYHIPP